jgi:hypothetical protein
MPLKERLTHGRVPTEFDKFADTCADLLKDPIRGRFAGSGDAFFYSRKLNVLTAFLKGRGLVARMGWFEKSFATILFGGQYAVFCRKVDGKPTFAY